MICEEFEQLNWIRPDVLLEREERRLITPTRHCLELLRASSTVSEAMEASHIRGMVEGDEVRAVRRAR